MKYKPNFKYLFFFLAIIVLFATSCEEKIDLKLDDSYERLVVDATITNETKAHVVKLTKTTNYLHNEAAPAVSGAIVIINDGLVDIPLTETELGIYKTAADVMGIPGRLYTLKIKLDKEINGFKEYESSSLMKQTINMDTITCDVYDPEESPARYLLMAYGQEPATLEDYYLWKYYKNGKLETDTLSETVFTDDALVNGNYIPGMAVFLLDAQAGDTITLETRSISKDYYDFVISLMSETVWSAGSFGGPPANVKTNISNGALGYFTASATSFVSTVVVPQ